MFKKFCGIAQNHKLEQEFDDMAKRPSKSSVFA